MNGGWPKLLNLGCGRRFHSAWTNVDQVSTGPGVLAADLSRPLPFGNNSFDACYSSHVLEHFSRDGGARLLGEMFRVLRHGGTVRIVVPDLERLARGYLEALEQAARDPAAAERHEWMIVELIDQLVREQAGGEMARLLRTSDPAQRAFLESRLGAEALEAPEPARTSDRLRLLPAVLRSLRMRATAAVVSVAGGVDLAQAFRAAAFRRSGEVHLAAYDRLSLARALVQAGFIEPRALAHDQSSINGFASFALDTEGGKPRKPDSLFMEATRPAPETPR